MCGLGSITFDKTVGPKVAGRLDFAVSALLTALDHRGGDACGVMSVNANGRVVTQKAPCAAKVFNEGRNRIPGDTRAVAVHTRMATQGHEAWNRNNHPVRSRTTHVMHNGMVWDDALKRQHGEPEVDTYAIAVAAAEVAGGDVPAAQHSLDLCLAIAELEGSMAVIVVEEGAPFMATMRIDGSPLYTLTSQGVQIAASTSAAVRAVADALGIPCPMESYSYTVTKKKKGKDKKTTMKGTRPAIQLEAEGYVATWAAGTHTEAIANLPPRFPVIPGGTRGWQSTKPYGTWTDEERYGVGSQYLHRAGTTSGNWDPIPDEDLCEPDDYTRRGENADYEAIARKLLNAGDEFERCILCDEMTDDCETWHTVTACAECRQWYATDGPVGAVTSEGLGTATSADLEWGK